MASRIRKIACSSGMQSHVAEGQRNEHRPNRDHTHTHTHTHTHCLGWMKRKAMLSLPNKHTQIYTTHLLEISVCFLPRLCFLLPPLRICSHLDFFSTVRFQMVVSMVSFASTRGGAAVLWITVCAPGTFFRQRRGRSSHSAASGVEPMNRGDGPAGPDGEKLLCALLHYCHHQLSLVTHPPCRMRIPCLVPTWI